ncbi:MAG: hypothetical protein ABWY65_08855 [Thermoleophilaceae bacterium]
MRRALALLVVIAAAPAAVAAAPHRKPTAVGVGEREWRVALYRSEVPVGRVRFNVRNFGEDGHDLAVRNRAGKVLGRLAELRPDATGSLTVRLRRAGRYTVFCTLEGHEQLGMRATLKVRRRR